MTGHETVLLEEAVDALLQKPDGSYVDCTYGRGGHSQEIANRMGDRGRLMVIDKDVSAIVDARLRFKDDDRAVVVHGSFSRLSDFVDDQNMRPVDGTFRQFSFWSRKGERRMDLLQIGKCQRTAHIEVCWRESDPHLAKQETHNSERYCNRGVFRNLD